MQVQYIHAVKRFPPIKIKTPLIMAEQFSTFWTIFQTPSQLQAGGDPAHGINQFEPYSAGLRS